jgi:hypothetical protein
MKIRMYVKTKLANGQTMLSDDHELQIGRYNEYYLPALVDGGREREAWIIVTDDNGVETKLHLKR